MSLQPSKQSRGPPPRWQGHPTKPTLMSSGSVRSSNATPVVLNNTLTMAHLKPTSCKKIPASMKQQSSPITSPKMSPSNEETNSFKPSQLILDLRCSGSTGGYWNPISKIPEEKLSPDTPSCIKKKLSFKRVASASQLSNEIIPFKTNAPRWINGALVKDSGCQTNQPFKSELFQVVVQPIIPPSLEDEDLLRYFVSETIKLEPPARCRAPNADEMRESNVSELCDNMSYMDLINDITHVSSFKSKLVLDPTNLVSIASSNVLRPRPIRPGYSLNSSTPISDRSISVLSDGDGSSSVSSYSLPSSVSSPDSAKFVNLLDKNSMSSTSFFNPVGKLNYPTHFRLNHGFASNLL